MTEQNESHAVNLSDYERLSLNLQLHQLLQLERIAVGDPRPDPVNVRRDMSLAIAETQAARAGRRLTDEQVEIITNARTNEAD